jgi:NitT/TauT family transport system permease protein
MSDTTSPSPDRLPLAASVRRVAGLPNLIDLAVIACMIGAAFVFGGAARHTFAPLSTVTATSIHLDPAYLPGYALRTTLRMFAALACSLLFTFTYAVWAAKSRRAGLVLLPILDILQSVPILSFLTFTTTFFLSLAPGSVLGAEFCCIFVIFTSQAWNMAFSMFQSLQTIPAELDEASRGFRLSAWQRFWRLEVPFAMPGLVWNMLMSMSGGWFMLVAAEAVTVGSTTWTLPGIGSYVAEALAHRDVTAIFWAIGTMLVVILLYDQLLFRPLVAWSSKFRYEMTQGAVAADPWMLALLRRTTLLRRGSEALSGAVATVGGLPIGRRGGARTAEVRPSRAVDAIGVVVLVCLAAYALWRFEQIASQSLTLADFGHVLLLGCYTLARVLAMIALATIVWVPVGVWLGLRPVWARRAQPVAQFLAAFPANLFYPIFAIVIVHFSLNPSIWLTPLMVLGTQWYILFNVIAGAAVFPGDLLEAAANFRVGSFLWWRRVVLPGVFPYFVTGAITASGGSWNASIVAEVVTWGHTTLRAEGLGAYIAQATSEGATIKVVLGTVVMSGFVLAFNRFFWRPLYAYSSRRLTVA